MSRLHPTVIINIINSVRGSLCGAGLTPVTPEHQPRCHLSHGLLWLRANDCSRRRCTRPVVNVSLMHKQAACSAAPPPPPGPRAPRTPGPPPPCPGCRSPAPHGITRVISPSRFVPLAASLPLRQLDALIGRLRLAREDSAARPAAPPPSSPN